MEIVSEKIVKANKTHRCDGCDFYLDGYSWSDFTFSQKKELLKAARDKWKILKGQQYRRASVSDGSSIWTFKVRIDVDAFLDKHGIYQEVNEYH